MLGVSNLLLPFVTVARSLSWTCQFDDVCVKIRPSLASSVMQAKIVYFLPSIDRLLKKQNECRKRKISLHSMKAKGVGVGESLLFFGC
jgi:hypothetical protein